MQRINSSIKRITTYSINSIFKLYMYNNTLSFYTHTFYFYLFLRRLWKLSIVSSKFPFFPLWNNSPFLNQWIFPKVHRCITTFVQFLEIPISFTSDRWNQRNPSRYRATKKFVCHGTKTFIFSVYVDSFSRNLTKVLCKVYTFNVPMNHLYWTSVS